MTLRIGKKRWQTSVLIEGEKEASLVAGEEQFPNVNQDFGLYPVDVRLPERRTFWGAVKKSITYSKMGIYNMMRKVK